MKNIRKFFLTHSALSCVFTQNTNDFLVQETPLYEFENTGEHLILKVRKKDISTWDLINYLSSALNIKAKDIGYAGLKDKNSTSIQHISVHRSCEGNLKNINDKKIEILQTFYHKNKIKLGHLKGNLFFVRLKRVSKIDAQKLDFAVQKISEFGMPNFFGYQRFGLDKDNHKSGEALLKTGKKPRTKLEKMFLSAYQSFLFNSWLNKRIEFCHLLNELSQNELETRFNLTALNKKELLNQTHFFKILKGDVCLHYPFGRLFLAEDETQEAQKFYAKQIAPTGLITGKKTLFSAALAKEFEKEIPPINAFGDRRYAWVFADFVSNTYKPEERHYELSFYLPKGAYATTLIEELMHQNLG